MPLASATIMAQPFGLHASKFGGLHQLGQSNRDGTFEFSSILAGTYFILASLPGYASPAYLLEAQTINPFVVPRSFIAAHTVLATVLDSVSITPQIVSVCNLFLQKGASIAGRVTWQDGAPARGNTVILMLVDSERRRPYEHLWKMQTFGPDYPVAAVTDENGRFNIDSLFTGKYIVGHHVPQYLSYVRKSSYPDKGPATINCFSSFYWTGQEPYFMDALPIDVICGNEVVGLDTQLPMLEQKPSERLPPNEFE